jgi:hypothetical protein
VSRPISHAARLSARTTQPGHDLSWRSAESIFSSRARRLLPRQFSVTEKPADLRAFYDTGSDRPLGLVPEVRLCDEVSGRLLYIEVKRQGPRGNAEERAYRHHTAAFIRMLAKHTELDYHAYATVFCDSLAVDRRYTTKIAAHIEPGHFLLWARYDRTMLATWLDEVRDQFLDPNRTCRDRSVAILDRERARERARRQRARELV